MKGRDPDQTQGLLILHHIEVILAVPEVGIHHQQEVGEVVVIPVLNQVALINHRVVIAQVNLAIPLQGQSLHQDQHHHDHLALRAQVLQVIINETRII